jgi:GNAT superfamily N-acetyltransferase
LWGSNDRKERDTVFEFYVIPTFRKEATAFFTELLHTSKAGFIQCQTNDALLTGMVYTFANNITAEAILFEDNAVTALTCPGVMFRPKKSDDKIFGHKGEPEGDYVLEKDGEIIATGGFLLHYNIPYADLYMEVREDERRKGYGSFLIQEIKRECYLAARMPAARCNLSNVASKLTLQRAGFKICGYRLMGEVAQRL